MCFVGHREALRRQPCADLSGRQRGQILPHRPGLQLDIRRRKLRADVPEVDGTVLYPWTGNRVSMRSGSIAVRAHVYRTDGRADGRSAVPILACAPCSTISPLTPVNYAVN